MPKLNSGVLGAFSGKLDSVVGYRRKGVNVISGRSIFKAENINPLLLTRAEILKQASYKFETNEGMLIRCMNVVGQSYRVNHSNILKSIFQNGVYNNPEYSGPFYFRGEQTPIHLQPAYSFNPAIRNAVISFNGFKRWSGYYQNNQFLRFGMVQSLGVPYLSLDTSNIGQISAGGGYGHFALYRVDTIGMTFRSAVNQNIGDTLVMTVRKLP